MNDSIVPDLDAGIANLKSSYLGLFMEAEDRVEQLKAEAETWAPDGSWPDGGAYARSIDAVSKAEREVAELARCHDVCATGFLPVRPADLGALTKLGPGYERLKTHAMQAQRATFLKPLPPDSPDSSD